MKVSVIVAVYNGEQFLRECLDSIVKQSFREFELIVVNDGSTDGTACELQQFCRQEADIPILVLEQDRKGLPQARKKGLQSASGAYTVFVDADDRVEPEHLLSLLMGMQQDVEMACCGYRIISEHGTLRKKIPCISEPGIPYEQITGEQALKLVLQREGVYQYLWNKMFRTDLLKSLIFPENNPVGEDFYITLQYLKLCSRVAICNVETYGYRFHCNSMTQQGFSRERREGYYLLREIFHQWPEADPYKSELANYLCLEYLYIVRCMVGTKAGDARIEQEILSFLDNYRGQYIRSSKDPVKAKVFALTARKSTLALLHSLFRRKYRYHRESNT